MKTVNVSMLHSQGEAFVSSLRHSMGNYMIETMDTQIVRTVNARASAKSAEEEKANAELIAEAFNVVRKTGKAPRELSECLQRGEKALTDINDFINNLPVSCTWAQEFRQIQKIVQEALLKNK